MWERKWLWWGGLWSRTFSRSVDRGSNKGERLREGEGEVEVTALEAHCVAEESDVGGVLLADGIDINVDVSVLDELIYSSASAFYHNPWRGPIHDCRCYVTHASDPVGATSWWLLVVSWWRWQWFSEDGGCGCEGKGENEASFFCHSFCIWVRDLFIP